MKKNVFFSVALLISLLVSAQEYPIDTIQYMGSSDNHVNLVFLGDGYVESEMNTFVEDVQKATNAFFKETPWNNYKDYFNVFLIKTPSKVSGAGMSPKETIHNFYGTTFGFNGTDRLLYPNNITTVRRVLKNHIPNYNIPVIIVNSTKYGGAGGEVMTFSKAPEAFEIFLHEVGHGFADLADEYWPGDARARERPNMTRINNSKLIKWKNWCGSEGIGIYPYFEKPTWFKPSVICKMGSLGPDYCAVCRQAIIESIHEIVNPINSYQPDNSTPLSIDTLKLVDFDVTKINPTLKKTIPYMRFKLDLIKPNPNTLDVTWTLNGKVIGTNQDSLIINFKLLTKEELELIATVEDKTNNLRVDDHSTIHAHSVRWLLGIASGIDVQSVREDYLITQMPRSIKVEVTCSNAKNRQMNVILSDLSGKVVVEEKTNKEGYCFLSTSRLTNGIYILSVYDKRKLTYSRKFTI
ncbi:MAG: M64 family metallopeptidase [Bacteroidaceae bacterium]|nr:M64 family metallopeptidase [Bacteroidaceae bacterium]